MTLRLITMTEETLKAIPAHPQIMITNHFLSHTHHFHHIRGCLQEVFHENKDKYITSIVNLKVQK